MFRGRDVELFGHELPDVIRIKDWIEDLVSRRIIGVQESNFGVVYELDQESKEDLESGGADDPARIEVQVRVLEENGLDGQTGDKCARLELGEAGGVCRCPRGKDQQLRVQSARSSVHDPLHRGLARVGIRARQENHAQSFHRYSDQRYFSDFRFPIRSLF